jgi:nucleoside-diphosphate-sugar epimerase
MRRGLITGATGFVGANLARRLIVEDCEPHLLVRPQFQSWRLNGIRDQVTLHEVAIANRDAVMELVNSLKPHSIFHLATHGAYPTQQGFDRMVETNILGTAALVDAAVEAGVEAFIYTGSSSEYGLKHGPADETDRVDPNSHYAITKATGTHYCQWAARAHQLPVAIMRLYSIYGPFEQPSRFIPTLIVHALQQQLPPLVRPETGRDFVYVDDAVEALLLAAERIKTISSGSIFNVASGQQSTIAGVVSCVRELLQVEAEPQWDSMTSRTWDTDRWVGNPLAITESLAWRAQTPLREGLQKTISWFAGNPDVLGFYRRTLGLHHA